jgi:hypothetical protein
VVRMGPVVEVPVHVPRGQASLAATKQPSTHLSETT